MTIGQGSRGPLVVSPAPLGLELRIYSDDKYFSITVTQQEAHQLAVWINDMGETRRLESKHPTIVTVSGGTDVAAVAATAADPWYDFLRARKHAIDYLLGEGHTCEDVARILSMDGEDHVRRIVGQACTHGGGIGARCIP